MVRIKPSRMMISMPSGFHANLPLGSATCAVLPAHPRLAISSAATPRQLAEIVITCWKFEPSIWTA